jgi:hypothetical protein
MSRHIYLAKANNDLVSHCECDEALITFPPQMDCPWCGCGWLFSCITCRKAFTFAKGIETDETWEELARRDISAMFQETPEDEYVAQWIEAMQQLTADVEPDQEYVCFDGVLVPTDVSGLEYVGWHAAHNLDFVPQVKALEDESIMEEILANMDYWESHAVGDEDDDDD